MNRKILYLAIALFGLLTSPLVAAQYKIVTGAYGGTYHTFGRNISSVAKKKDVKMDVEKSFGSTSNVMILSLGQADFGICQYDVFSNMARYSRTRSLAGEVSVVMPLYHEEVHLVARADSGINSLSDLDGKSVSMGQVNSGTFYTARALLQAAKVSYTRVLANYSSPKEAFAAMKKGNLDAMFYTSGRPVSLLSKVTAKHSHNFKLVSISKSVLGKLARRSSAYSIAKIPSGTYKFQDSDVYTLATPAVLLARDDVSPLVVRDVCSQIFRHAKSLRKKHGKWAELSRSMGKKMALNSKLHIHPGAKKFFLGMVASKGTVRLTAGSANGTYTKIAKDIQTAAILGGVKVLQMPSGGSGHNILAVATKQADMGISQLDVLFYFSLSHPNLVADLRCAMPLYYEEVHLVTRKGSGVKSVADLKGKKVGVGALGSGTSMTSDIILSAYKLNSENTTFDTSHSQLAFQKLVEGRLDAAFFVGGSPLGTLQRLKSKAKGKLTLVSLDNDALTAVEESSEVFKNNVPYKVVTVAKGTYSWLDSDVKTLATPAIILTNSSVKPEILQTITRSVLSQASSFSHSKWRGYNLERMKKYFASGEITVAPHPAIQMLLEQKEQWVTTDLLALKYAVQSYQRDMGSYPKKLADLLEHTSTKWRGPYLETANGSVPKDPWNREYVYKVTDKGFTVISYGADGKPGGDEDDSDHSSDKLKTEEAQGKAIAPKKG